MHFSKLILQLILITSLTTFASLTANARESSLQLEEIMAGNDFIGHQPSNFSWDYEGENIYFLWQKEDALIPHYYVYNLKQDKVSKVIANPKTQLPLSTLYASSVNKYYFKSDHTIIEHSKDGNKIVFSSTERFRILSITNDKLILKQNQNIYAFDPTCAHLKQLTYFKTGTARSKEPALSYLEEQHLYLFETARVAKAKKAAQEAYNKTMSASFINPFYLEDKNMDAITVSDNLNYAIFRIDEYPINPSTTFANYMSTDGYTSADRARSKVGATNPTHELYVWDFVKDTAVKVDFSQLSDINLKPGYFAEYENLKNIAYTKDLIHHIHGVNSSNDKCLIEIKSYDNKDRWIGYIDLATYSFIELNHQHDDAWIGGPGITGWNMVKGNAGWINTTEFFFQSEESGYSHLYSCNAVNKKTVALTNGKFEIHEASLSLDKKAFYITANKNHPGNRSFYKLDIASKTMLPILTKDGNHEVLVSPNEKMLLVNYSSKNEPWDLYIGKNEKNTELQRITDSKSEDFKKHTWREPEVISFKASDGQDVNARIYKPTSGTKNNAAVFFVHGAGYLQNAHNWWSGYYREYMFNNMLCDLGYTVMDIDFRASKGYGSDFRTAIYREMGGKDLSDYVDARQLLIDEYGIDENRVGIYGGSYGGFISIMALLTEPGKFQCGAAVRSVTDWAHYNHPYTSNILNTPETDPKAFEKSSPIYYAENLEDQLLMLHGIVDDNVQYQDVVRLSQRFIELGKQKWDLVGYPIEPHGFKETTSWIDEYGRILNLFNTNLLKK